MIHKESIQRNRTPNFHVTPIASRNLFGKSLISICSIMLFISAFKRRLIRILPQQWLSERYGSAGVDLTLTWRLRAGLWPVPTYRSLVGCHGTAFVVFAHFW